MGPARGGGNGRRSVLEPAARRAGRRESICLLAAIRGGDAIDEMRIENEDLKIERKRCVWEKPRQRLPSYLGN